MEMVEFLLSNIFIENGGVIRRQVVGIPMGTNCAPLLANLFLYYYESRYIDSLPVETARQFHNTWRYIDDTLSIDNPEWVRAVENIYPPELQLNDTSLQDEGAHFLGMEIHSKDATRFSIKVFDKWKMFPFPYDVIPKSVALFPLQFHMACSWVNYIVVIGFVRKQSRLWSIARMFSTGALTMGVRKGVSKIFLIVLFSSMSSNTTA